MLGISFYFFFYKSLLLDYDLVYGCISLLISIVVIYFIILVIIPVLLSLGIEHCCIFVRNRILPDVELLHSHILLFMLQNVLTIRITRSCTYNNRDIVLTCVLIAITDLII